MPVTTNAWRFTLRQTRSCRPEKRSAPVGEVIYVSIVRVGLAETKKFAEGYETIFGKKKSGDSEKTKTVAKNSAAKKKKKSSKKR